MRILPLVAAITISLSSMSTLAQEALIEFVDGEIASAEDVNSNFKHLSNRLRAIEGKDGCYARDEDGSTIVECADGTSVTLESGEGRLDGINSNATAIATNAENVAANRADIDTNTANIALNTESIVANNAGIDTNTANVTLNTQSIVANRADIDTNTANIAANRADIDFLMSSEYSGCSAAQDGSSVVISCADGSSGVLASAGTVVVYPEGGVLGAAPLQSWPTGEIVWKDAAGLTIGRADGSNIAIIDGYKVGIKNNEESNEVNLVGGSAAWLFFLTADCTGQIFIKDTVKNTIHKWDLYYVGAPSVATETLLYKSYIAGNGYTTGPFVNEDLSCIQKVGTATLVPAVEYQFSAELQMLSYPASLVQLP